MPLMAILALLMGMYFPTKVSSEEYRHSAAYRLSVGQSAMLRTAPDENVSPVPEGIVSVLAGRSTMSPDSQLEKMPYSALIHSAAQDAFLDPALVHAVIYVESRYNPNARSPKGAIGLMQVMRETALRYGIKDPAQSIDANLAAGTRYLRDLMQQFPGRLDLVLAAYNAGENAVLRYQKRIPPFRETQRYVPAVLAKYFEWRESVFAAEVLTAPVPVAAVTSFHVEYIPGTRFDPSKAGWNSRLKLVKVPQR